MPKKEVQATLDERGTRYGDFTGHAYITQEIKRCMRSFELPSGIRPWGLLSNDKQEALDMIAHKIGRILNGDPDYADSWHDIAGYATLAEQRCKEKK